MMNIFAVNEVVNFAPPPIGNNDFSDLPARIKVIGVGGVAPTQ